MFFEAFFQKNKLTFPSSGSPFQEADMLKLKKNKKWFVRNVS